MKITIGENGSGPTTNVFRSASLPVREKILRFLFGEPKRIMIIVPGRSVNTMEIKEVSEDA